MCTTDTKQLHTGFVARVNLWHAVHLANEFLCGHHYVISERALAKANQVSVMSLEHLPGCIFLPWPLNWDTLSQPVTAWNVTRVSSYSTERGGSHVLGNILEPLMFQPLRRVVCNLLSYNGPAVGEAHRCHVLEHSFCEDVCKVTKRHYTRRLSKCHQKCLAINEQTAAFIDCDICWCFNLLCQYVC